jgi:hypothetical protein
MSLSTDRLWRLPVNQDHRTPRGGQLSGGNQTGQAGSDDDDIAIHGSYLSAPPSRGRH